MEFCHSFGDGVSLAAIETREENEVIKDWLGENGEHCDGCPVQCKTFGNFLFVKHCIIQFCLTISLQNVTSFLPINHLVCHYHYVTRCHVMFQKIRFI